MRRARDAALDFTSLLDIVLIILFFFVLYGTIDADRASEEAERTRAAYEEGLDELDAERARLDAEWDRLNALDENAARNQRALNDFGRGSMLSFVLRKEDASDDWTLNVLGKDPATGEDVPAGVIGPGSRDGLAEAFLALFDELGIGEDEVTLVSFIYDGEVLGTFRLCRDIEDALAAAQAVRRNLYVNSVNISR